MVCANKVATNEKWASECIKGELMCSEKTMYSRDCGRTNCILFATWQIELNFVELSIVAICQALTRFPLDLMAESTDTFRKEGFTVKSTGVCFIISLVHRKGKYPSHNVSDSCQSWESIEFEKPPHPLYQTDEHSVPTKNMFIVICQSLSWAWTIAHRVRDTGNIRYLSTFSDSLQHVYIWHMTLAPEKSSNRTKTNRTAESDCTWERKCCALSGRMMTMMKKKSKNR